MGLEHFSTHKTLIHPFIVTIPHGGLGTSAGGLNHLRILLLVTIPHGGLGTFICCLFSSSFFLLSPSHTVGSELLFAVCFHHHSSCCHHPTRWARNGVKEESIGTQGEVTIPHGGLGTRNAIYGLMRARVVTIPHGGLGTLNHLAPVREKHRSPSHTVGSEQGEVAEWLSAKRVSPSHTVGSEQLGWLLALA